VPALSGQYIGAVAGAGDDRTLVVQALVGGQTGGGPPTDFTTVAFDELRLRADPHRAGAGQRGTPGSSAFPGTLCVPLWTNPSGEQVITLCGHFQKYDHGHVTRVTMHPPCTARTP
jgi:hypothetical protein